MTDKPILFSGPMVRALLENRKFQTRRVFVPPAPFDPDDDISVEIATGSITPPYAPGDRLWVKEDHWAIGNWETTGELTKTGRPKWRFVRDWNKAVAFERPDEVAPERRRTGWHKRNGRFMFQRDSRLTLTVTDVRVQRLQEISAENCIAEGVECTTCAASWSVGRSACNGRGCFEIRQNFRDLWNSLHGPDAWGDNPWVVALTFDVHRCNIDQMEAANEGGDA